MTSLENDPSTLYVSIQLWEQLRLLANSLGLSTVPNPHGGLKVQRGAKTLLLTRTLEEVALFLKGYAASHEDLGRSPFPEESHIVTRGQAMTEIETRLRSYLAVASASIARNALACGLATRRSAVPAQVIKAVLVDLTNWLAYTYYGLDWGLRAETFTEDTHAVPATSSTSDIVPSGGL